ncbi:MAG: sugar phosphate nucleotidyltransferase [Ignisphaera sp.]|nr:sugar phosphate nucleotidyltransferase [Ignisphaera sp.]
MIGILLAAGRGKRLAPLTETKPKVLLPIAGKPIVYRPLLLLKRLGVSRVIVVVHYMKDAVMEYIRKVSNELYMDVEFVDQGSELGTGDAVRKAIDKGLDNAVVIYGDLYLDVDHVSRKLLEVINSGANYVTGVYVDDVSRYGCILVSGDRVIDLIEKPNEGGKGIANAGIYILRSQVLKLVDDIDISPRGEYELTDIIRLGNARGYEFSYATIDSRAWCDVGYPWDLLEVNKIELSKLEGRVVRGEVESCATIKGPVIIDEGASIRGCTYMEGPVYIGKDSNVGPNSYIRPYTTIMDKAHIGFSVEVKESIIMENTHVAHLTYIGDSVIAENINLGAGTIIANLRLDDKTVKLSINGKKIDSRRIKMGAIVGGYTKTGVNVSIMPGVKIGSHSIIYPGVTVYRDVPANTIVKRDWI